MRNRRRQSGFGLIEVVLAISLLAVATSFFYRDVVVEGAVNKLTDAAGQHHKAYAIAHNRYLDAYRTELLNGLPIVGVANPYAPTWAELVALTMAPPSITAQSPAQFFYTSAIQRVPAACVPPACVDLTGRFWSTTPVTNGIGQPDVGRAAAIAMAAGTDGAHSDITNANLVRGVSGVWLGDVNPLGAVQAIVFGRFGFGTAFDTSQFYLLNGSRALTGTMNANNQNIQNVQNLSTQGGATNISNTAVSAPALAAESAPGVPRFSVDGPTGILSGNTGSRVETTIGAVPGIGARAYLQGSAIETVGGTVVARDGGGAAKATIDGLTGNVGTNGGTIAANDAGGIPRASIKGATGEVSSNAGRLAVLDAAGVATLAEIQSTGRIATANASVVAGGTGTVEGDRATIRGTAAQGAPCAAAENGQVARDSATGNNLVICGFALDGLGQAWRTAGGVQTATMNNACAPPGAFAIDLATQAAMVCRGGFWLPLNGALLPKFVLTNSYIYNGGVDGVLVPGPSPFCAGGGTPTIYIVPQDGALQGNNLYALPYTGGPAGTWTIAAKDNNGVGPLIGVLVQVGCWYN